MSVVIKPLITEKMTDLSEKRNQYGFVVNRKANKVEIRKAIEEQYNVTVTNVNTMIYAGKNKKRYTKSAIVDGRTNHFKKAMVTVADGDVIDFYANI
ncbi:MAG: 50S ribosomal protein L23 [Flavobacteriales bacterium]|mgnify:FL=1|jgi:large subunit ribosomal protein L23|nr:50S ribosomal protein L23 [Flavobacteriales bacterium]NCG30607.1 50S ribosomal protein L23 [Bacteroidota bacterium]MBT3963956.1 50S ribosomal protein L23 [Flavobacteriales bacterium]MBT4704885.1 50S ribosomal protein L23 [Flavobacteriales bacterium]MBT4929660.1 50S ribosomal protein L23 [Flavobacteriales bacterium]